MDSTTWPLDDPRSLLLNELKRIYTWQQTRSEAAEAEEELPEDNVVEEDNGSSGSDSRTVIGTYVTDENGEILVEDLPTGQYVFVETKPLDW